MRVLVTGHNGYIGSVMIPVLQNAGHEVIGLDTYYFEDCTFKEEPVQVPSLRADIRDITDAALQGFDAIIHLAALCNDPLGDLNPDWTYDINHSAAVHLAKMAKNAGVQRFLFASSCSMYGAANKEEVLTEIASLHPLTPYAISKVRTEEDVAQLADTSFSPVFLRNATAYGVSPRFRADIVLNNLVCWAYTTGKVRILSDGTPWRPIIHVEDIALAFAAVLTAPQELIHNQAFNVGVNNENYQVRELAEIVQEIIPECEVEYAAQGGPDPRDYKVDFSKLATMLPSFQPKWNAWLGVKELFSVLQQNGFTLEDFQNQNFTRLRQLNCLISAGYLDSTLRWKNGGEI